MLTLFGRKCHYPDIGASNASIRAFNERAAVNARLQGTAADIIRRAMIRMDAALAKKKLSAQMLLQVHDELVFEVPEAEVEKTLPVVTKVMVDAPLPALSLSVPLQVEAHGCRQLGRRALRRVALIFKATGKFVPNASRLRKATSFSVVHDGAPAVTQEAR